MDRVEETKLGLAIMRATDPEILRSHAMRLLATLGTISRAGEAFTVRDEHGGIVATGTKDYCIGWAEGRDGVMAYGGSQLGPYKVTCGDFEVWPNWGGS